MDRINPQLPEARHCKKKDIISDVKIYTVQITGKAALLSVEANANK